MLPISGHLPIPVNITLCRLHEVLINVMTLDIGEYLFGFLGSRELAVKHSSFCFLSKHLKEAIHFLGSRLSLNYRRILLSAYWA